MSSSSREASVAAGDQAKRYEKLLALRISMQKVLDSSNKLPVLDDDSGAKKNALATSRISAARLRFSSILQFVFFRAKVSVAAAKTVTSRALV